MDRQQEQKDLKDAYRIVFKSPAGQKVLADIMDKCYFGKKMYDDNPNIIYFREGRRDLFLYIQMFLLDEV